MSQDLSTIGVTGATSDSGTAQPAATDSPSAQDTGKSSLPDVTQAPVQGQESPKSDPLEGIPSAEELETAETVSKKAFLQLRGAYDSVKPQFDELQTKYSVFEPLADRFERTEELQELVDFKEKLFGYERDDANQLVPATSGAAQYLQERYREHADYLTADLLDMPTVDPDTGRQLPRIDLVLEAWKEDPQRRAHALQILGGVEPTAIAPTWQPSEDELTAIVVDPDNPTNQDKALQDIYRTLPYDERQALRLNDPDFIRNYLKKEQGTRQLLEQNRISAERETQRQQQRERYFQQQAESAGNTYVEKGFRDGFTEFANSIVEKSKFLSPIDPQSDAGKAMAPEQLAEMNAKIQRTNTGVGKMVALVSAALAVPDTAWLMQDFLREIGLDEKTLQGYDSARLEYARNARDYGQLEYHQRQGQQNGNQQPHAGLGNLQTNTRKAMGMVKGQANAVAEPLLQLLSDFFELKAGTYNQTLNSAASVRAPVNGNGFNPTTAPAPRPSTTWPTREEINRQYGG